MSPAVSIAGMNCLCTSGRANSRSAGMWYKAAAEFYKSCAVLW